MENNRKSLVAIFTLVFVILLSACGNSSNESSAKADNQSQNNHSTQDTKDDSLDIDSTDSVLTNDDSNTGSNANKTDDTANNATKKDEDSSKNNTEADLKERYLKKLNDTKKETEELKATDSSTYALKKVENDRWEKWDELLNDIYGALKEHLPSNSMDQLREEQRNWLKYRDDSALKASLKYKGGTQEHLEYVAVLANLTEERCYELVESYMK
ncbi:lysozyme inhibitor LprI family protein [Bacillus sp. JJ1122]|uniref:lysozyme inhibitor LprI family protein n=1 Tax=Bacillus sp. JJ1122 TaxID=3122951 RepID=UPI002FFD62B2